MGPGVCAVCAGDRQNDADDACASLAKDRWAPNPAFLSPNSQLCSVSIGTDARSLIGAPQHSIRGREPCPYVPRGMPISKTVLMPRAIPIPGADYCERFLECLLGSGLRQLAMA